MTAFLNYYLEILKQAVLSNSGLKSVAPGDCKLISFKIFEATRQSVSETTLKRVYGFAYSKFRPSLFTIDVMARYCGYEGWDDFRQQQDGMASKQSASNANWEALKQNAAKITNFTLHALKNKSGIPYNQTIKRQFINQHLNEFLPGNYSATVLAAPAGYGKTIAICHWVENALSLNSTGESNDIILFFSSSALMNVFLSGRDLNDWLLGLLGYSTDKDLRALVDNGGGQDGNFYLIIDGLDEHSYKSEQFELLMDQVIDILALYQDTSWFKLIVSMRSATWMNNKHLLLQNHPESWHTGLWNENSNVRINVPLFTVAEIKELCLNINPSIKNFLAIDLAENFNHPLYFQFYYKEHKDNFSLNDLNHICLYELVSNFVLNKMYLGPHSDEKMLLLDELVGLMDFKKGGYDIDKLKVSGLIKQYHHAYHDLVSIGFLREINTSTNLHYQTIVQFGNNHFLNFAIARELLLKNGGAFDDKLIAFVNQNFGDNERKLQLIKWCLLHAAKTCEQPDIEALKLMDLDEDDKADLIIFLGELEEKARAKPQLYKQTSYQLTWN
jgi:hypothetical protein